MECVIPEILVLDCYPQNIYVSSLHDLIAIICACIIFTGSSMKVDNTCMEMCNVYCINQYQLKRSEAIEEHDRKTVSFTPMAFVFTKSTTTMSLEIRKNEQT